MLKELSVSYKGNISILNLFMLVQQGIAGDDDKIDRLLCFHFERLVVIDLMGRCESNDYDSLDKLKEKIIEIDFKLQEIWGFGRDTNWHRFWELPHCTCRDGECNLGTNMRLINVDCPLHGVRV